MVRAVHVAFATALTTLLSVLAVAADLPRYSLPVGRKLTYSISSESKPAAGGLGMKMTASFQLTVVRDNPDGSRRVILRTAETYGTGTGGEPQRVTLAYADVFPNGRI